MQGWNQITPGALGEPNAAPGEVKPVQELRVVPLGSRSLARLSLHVTPPPEAPLVQEGGCT